MSHVNIEVATQVFQKTFKLAAMQTSSAKPETKVGTSAQRLKVSKRKSSIQTLGEKGRFANAVGPVGHQSHCKRVVFVSLNDVICGR